MLMKQLETNERITISSISVGDFKYYGRFLSRYYYAIAGGKCLTGHIFTCQRNSTTMCIRTDDMETDEIHVQEIAIASEETGLTPEERLLRLCGSIGLEAIPTPGISERKQIGLYKDWRNIVPKEYWPFTCPKPSDEVLARFKNQGKDKLKAKKELANPGWAAARDAARACRLAASAAEKADKAAARALAKASKAAAKATPKATAKRQANGSTSISSTTTSTTTSNKKKRIQDL